MSKIKYPSDKVINEQIDIILDKSGMFKKKADNVVYTDCVKSSRRINFGKAVSFVGVVVAAAAVIIAVNNYVPSLEKKNPSGLTPLNSNNDSSSIDNISNTQYGKLGNYGTYSTKTYIKEETIEGRKIRFVYQIPEIMYRNNNLADITEFFETKDSNRLAQLKNTYSGKELNTVSQVSLSYTENSYSHIIGITENYKIRNVNTDGSEYTNTKTICYNYDINNNRFLTLEDILTDYDNGIAELKQRISEVMSKRLSDYNEDIKYYGDIVDECISDENIILMDNMIVVYVNYLDTVDGESNTDNKTYEAMYFQTSQLSYIKDIYR